MVLLLMMGCSNNQKNDTAIAEKSSYFDYSNSDDQVTGGIKKVVNLIKQTVKTKEPLASK